MHKQKPECTLTYKPTAQGHQQRQSDNARHPSFAFRLVPPLLRLHYNFKRFVMHFRHCSAASEMVVRCGTRVVCYTRALGTDQVLGELQTQISSCGCAFLIQIWFSSSAEDLWPGTALQQTAAAGLNTAKLAEPSMYLSQMYLNTTLHSVSA